MFQYILSVLLFLVDWLLFALALLYFFGVSNILIIWNQNLLCVLCVDLIFCSKEWRKKQNTSKTYKSVTHSTIQRLDEAQQGTASASASATERQSNKSVEKGNKLATLSVKHQNQREFIHSEHSKNLNLQTWFNLQTDWQSPTWDSSSTGQTCISITLFDTSRQQEEDFQDLQEASKPLVETFCSPVN